MELRQLTTFVRVAQFQSFSKAAASLGYSQSAVTVQIRLLEEELGVRLFDRMGKRVSLTGQGRIFQESAIGIIQDVNRAKQSLAGADEVLRGQIHIGTLESLCYASFLLRVLEETEGLTFLPWFLVEEPVRQGKLSVVEVSDLQAVMYSQIFYHRDKWATREMEEFVRFCTPKKA